MEKSEFRFIIKHYFLLGKSAKITKEKLDKYYGTSPPSDYMVKYWVVQKVIADFLKESKCIFNKT